MTTPDKTAERVVAQLTKDQLETPTSFTHPAFQEAMVRLISQALQAERDEAKLWFDQVTRDLHDRRKRITELTEALRKCQSWVHSEVCGSKGCHADCLLTKQALKEGKE